MKSPLQNAGAETRIPALESPEQTVLQEVGQTLALEGIPSDWSPRSTIPRRGLRQPGLERLGGTTRVARATEAAVRDELDAGEERPELDAARRNTPAIEVVGSIGKGGMGWIRRAQQCTLDREVVIKTVVPGRLGHAAQDALMEEARITGRLEHPNIVPVHDLGFRKVDGPMMVMKLIEGAPWSALIADPTHPLMRERGAGDAEGEAADASATLGRHLDILMDVCQAAHYAHSRGVVHRDIKPDNVMVGGYGEVYLLDWGVATDADGSDSVVGTPAYMAPELADPAATATPRTDVYLLGATLHEVLTGQPRHAGVDAREVMARARLSEPATYGPDVPPELAEICNTACARDPADRYPDALAMRRAISEFIRHRSSNATARQALATLAELETVVADFKAGSSDVTAAEPEDELTLRAHRLYSACRFGLEQALREWSGNTAAEAGLDRCLRVMIDWELLTRNHRSAALLLAELQTPAADLERRLQDVRRGEADREAAEAELERLRKEARIHGLGWGRTWATLVNGVVTMIVLLVTGAGIRHGWLEPTREGIVWWAAMCAAMIAIGLYGMRRVLLDNRRYGQLMIALVMLGPLLLLSSAWAFLVDIELQQMLVVDFIMLTAVVTTLGAVFDRAFWWSALLAALMGTVALAFPDYSLDLAAYGWGINSMYVAWLVRPRPDADEATQVRWTAGGVR